jgi:hypothetical protein
MSFEIPKPQKTLISIFAGTPNPSLERTVRMLALRAILRPAAQLEYVRFPDMPF